MKKRISLLLSMLLMICTILAYAIPVMAEGDNYTIVFEGNGATSGTTPNLEVPRDATSFVMPECGYTWPGHTFVGWGIGDLRFAKPGDEVSGEAYQYLKRNFFSGISFSALWWDDSRKCTIIFDGNDASSGSTAPLTNITIDSNSKIPDSGFEKDGFLFFGWTVMPSLSETDYPGETLSVDDLYSLFRSSDNVTLYAVWRNSSDTWEIGFGSDIRYTGTMDDITGLTPAMSVVVPDCAYKWDGHKFSHWRIKDTSGEILDLIPGQTIPVYSLRRFRNPSNIILLHACWSDDSNVIYYDSNTFIKETDGTMRCYDSAGNAVINQFKCDGTYTYFFQADGTAMTDRLSYHPDGQHVIYFDSQGHEVFSNFANVKKTISGDAVNDFCFFDTFGYLYVDVLTYDQAGQNIYYANPYGVMEVNKWFQFSNNVKWADGTQANGHKNQYGYAQYDGTLLRNSWTYDWEGRWCYMQGNGVAVY